MLDVHGTSSQRKRFGTADTRDKYSKRIASIHVPVEEHVEEGGERLRNVCRSLSVVFFADSSRSGAERSQRRYYIRRDGAAINNRHERYARE